MVSPLTRGPQLFADLNPNNYNVNSSEHNHLATEKTENMPVPSLIIGGGAHIYVFVFCTISFFWNRLFFAANTNVWICAHPIIELATGLTENEMTDDIRPKIWIRISFLGKQGEFLVKKLLKKIQRNLTDAVKLVVICDTKKVSYFLPK